MKDWSRQLTVRLFGRPEIISVPAGKFPAKGFLLLGLVLRMPEGRMSRAEAANLLWDSSKDGDSLANLRQLLSRLRRLQPVTGELIRAESTEVRLGADISAVDLYHFNQMAAGSAGDELIEQILLYRDEFLHGVDEPTEPFSDWLFTERASIRRSFFSAVDAALAELTRYGRAPRDSLVRIKELVIALEPEREASYRSLIEAFGRNGMYDEARELFGDLQAMSRRLFNADPSPETLAVVRRVFANATEISSAAQTDAVEMSRPALQGMPRVALLAVNDPAGVADPALIQALFEDIANELSRYRTFSVLAPYSSQAVAHRSGIPERNDVLNADYSVSGFVKPGGEAVLAIRMVDCRGGTVVWSGEYAAGREELIRTFRILSSQVAASLATEIEREMLAASGVDTNGNAYWHYLQGQHLMKDCSLQGLRRARKLFRQASRLDPGFALPNGRIAQTYYLEWLIRGGSEPELLLKSRQYANIAVQLDRGAAIGFWINAIVDLYQRRFDEAAEQFAEAEALNPNCADLLVEHADALGHLGQADLGWKKFERAVELNPTPPDHYWWAGASIAFCQERYHKAIELCGKMQNNEPAVRLLAASHALLGQEAEARAYGRRIKEMYPSQPAGEIIKVAPTRVDKVGELFLKGLRLAGV